VSSKPSAGAPVHNPSVNAISAFFPCYNDEFSIAGMVTDARAALTSRVDDLEIKVVDDG
jgi:hypothetical protein